MANNVLIPCALRPLRKLKGFLLGKNSADLQMGSALGIPRQVRAPWIAGGGVPNSALYLHHSSVLSQPLPLKAAKPNLTGVCQSRLVFFLPLLCE